jgi:hypothetical protein
MTGVGGDGLDERPPVYKAVGVALAIASGVFIGVSFVLKKKGLLAANLKDNKEAGEGYGYLKNFWWWTGMILSKSFAPGRGVEEGADETDAKGNSDYRGGMQFLCVCVCGGDSGYTVRCAGEFIFL